MYLEQFILKETDAHLSLVKHVISAHAQGRNLVISPLSIHVLLGLTVSGSRGPTRAQLLRYLNSDSSEQINSLFSQIFGTVLCDGSPLGGPVLSTQNGLWVDQSLNLKPDFRDIAANSYKAVAEHVDFKNRAEEARQQVNAWADNETNGLIKEIVPPKSVNHMTRLILANAVYFKGAWTEEFDASLTSDRDFYLINGSPVRTPFMTCWEKQRVRAFDGFKVLQLPYKRGEYRLSFSMYIYLPDARDGLPALIEKICSEPGFINRHLPNKEEMLAAFQVPKFKVSFGFEASEVLKGLGVVNLFEMGDLTEMVEDSDLGEKLCVSKILHKAFIEVNEQGTEAAAVTAEEIEEMGCGLWEHPQLEFVADHPFVFVLREDTTGFMLFVGQLLDPLAQ
ncbi:hypothetical protein C2S51_012283 [Perilla frutescens var. frutescens]|nr:hypothetical protein C2S51_012283 [Perilla frutescens var. frutescens]